MSKWIVPIVLLIITVIIGVAVGSVNVFSHHTLGGQILLNIRIPRVLLAASVGVGLTFSGIVFQKMLNNKMADSFTLGMANAAVLGSALSVVFGWSLSPLMSIVFGGIGLLFVLSVSRAIDQYYKPETLIISGILFGAMMSAVLYVLVLMYPEHTNSMTRYLFGTLSGANYVHVSLIITLTLIGFIVVYKLAGKIDIMQLGDDKAYTYGVESKKLRPLLITIASIPPLIAMSYTGVIALVGIIVPQLILYIQPMPTKQLLLLSALYGAIFLIISDTIGRTLISPVQIPVGVMVMMFAVPIFLGLLFKRRFNG